MSLIKTNVFLIDAFEVIRGSPRVKVMQNILFPDIYYDGISDIRYQIRTRKEMSTKQK